MKRSNGATVAEVMSKDPFVIAVDTPLDEAAEIMAAKLIRHLPVVVNGKLIGLVSHRDLLAATAEDETVADVMTERFAVTRPGAAAREAARALLTMKIGCLPVIDDGELVGIVTETDFVRVAYAVLSAAVARPRRKAVHKRTRRRAHAR